jgi:hypothetical protein
MINMHIYYAQIRSQRLARSMLHWIVIDKAGKLIAHISACSNKQQNNTHSIMKPAGILLLHPLQTRSWKHAYIYIYIYTYICPREKDDVHIRVSTCPYKLGCAHTCMRSVHVRASLAPSLATSEPLVTSVCYHRKKKPFSFHPELRLATFQVDLRYSMRRT